MTGGAGGGASANAFASSGTGAVTVTASQIGGAGGAGSGGGTGGAGASSVMMNEADGRTKGSLIINQTAQGGAGGDSGYFVQNGGNPETFVAGAGGGADSELMLNAASPSFEASSLEGTATAIGGNAGAASGGANLSAPSAGGDATAVANLAGAGDVTANAVAQGGAGSLAPLGVYRPGGGQATANATALATGGHAASALASATGGSLAGFGVNLVNAATASAHSGSGTVTVTAIQTGGSSPIMTLDQYDLVGGTGAGGDSALVTQAFGPDAALAVSGSTSGALNSESDRHRRQRFRRGRRCHIRADDCRIRRRALSKVTRQRLAAPPAS